MLPKPIPHTQAAALIAGKPALTREVWDGLRPELQARSFTICGVEALDALARVRDTIATLPAGGDFAEIKRTIYGEISPWLVDDTADEETQTKQRNAALRRAEMLLRLHGWQAYAQTNYELAEAHSDAFPYRQYLSSEDSRVRPSHAALNKKILPAAHLFWQNHTPPWEFNCRCDMVVMTAEEAEEISNKEKNLPPEDQKVLPPAQLAEIQSNARLVKPGGQGFLDLRTPRERSGGTGYEFRPAENALPLEQILERFTTAEKTTFMSWAQKVILENGDTLAAWWGIKKARKITKNKKSNKTKDTP